MKNAFQRLKSTKWPTDGFLSYVGGIVSGNINRSTLPIGSALAFQ